jgi:NADPH dehydrogenase (quinone)
MKNIFVINGGQNFGHSGGAYNNTITSVTDEFFTNHPDYNVQVTNIENGYNPDEEVTKYNWADIIIYHTPIWWFQVPFGLKKYLDEVFTAGHRKGIYNSDGRHAATPEIGYGTGGTMHGKHYMVTTTWNAPSTAFTLPGEFFGETSVDDGVLFGFHRMNAFVGLSKIEGFHFHDVMKNPDMEFEMGRYKKHLETVFSNNTVTA